MRPSCGERKIFAIEELPWLIIIWSQCECETPVSHRAGAVCQYALFEALRRFLVVERVCPDQTTVEPSLCVCAGACHLAMVAAQVIVLGICQALLWQDSLRPYGIVDWLAHGCWRSLCWPRGLDSGDVGQSPAPQCRMIGPELQNGIT